MDFESTEVRLPQGAAEALANPIVNQRAATMAL
jgi:hypothetical protein